MRTQKIKIIISIVFSLFYIHQAVGADAVEQLKTFTKQVKNAEGEFLQQQVSSKNVVDGKPKIIRQSQGKFAFMRPGKFVWETLKPFEQVLIADGKQLIMWDKDLNQVTYRAANQALAATPAAILFGDTALDTYFNLNVLADKGGMAWVELMPKANKDHGNDLPYSKIGVGMQNDQPQAMELYDTFGNVVLLTFTKIKTNTSLQASRFNFSPPVGAEIVRMK